MSDAARILVVDDDPKIRAVVRRGLAYEGYRVVEAASGEDGLDKAREHLPDLVILDVMMPGLSGLEVTRRLRSSGDAVAILMLTARDEVRDRVEGLETGADDYLVKPFNFEELLARVHALLRRRAAPAGEILRFADLELDVDAREAGRGDRRIELTTTEYNLLLLFMRHPRKVLTRDVIMEHVWAYDFDGESNVLEVYVRYLRNKLEAGHEPRLLHTVRGAGYVLRE
ncbi:MAG: response regulator transcription factor [Chloroflexi bacterium]|nr:response regulator transcription factor [Chloroflexota bacterium]MDA8236879.1 response regulator transcription factor [Chloroflexota bacterium]